MKSDGLTAGIPKKSDGISFAYAMSLATQLGFLVVSSIGGFILLGIWIDTKIATAPFFVILGVIVGVVLTIYEVHHMIKPLITSGDKTQSGAKKL